jgi:hypothetical protein
MKQNLIIIDDFYQDPDSVRNFALLQDFNVRGNYPGQRTIPLVSDSAKEIIANILRPVNGEITHWPATNESYNGAFQYTTAKDRSWIHADQTTTWAAVCYLTPDAPLTAGTGLFKHIETGLLAAPKKPNGEYNSEILDVIYKDSQDLTRWEMTTFVGNIYNRLVIYRGDNFHTSLDYFGKDINDGRLFQTFFFNTEF